MLFAAGPSLQFSVGGTSRLELQSTLIAATIPLRGTFGSASAPGFAFAADSNTGMFAVGFAPDNYLAFSVQSQTIVTITGATGEPRGINVDGNMSAVSGTFSQVVSIDELLNLPPRTDTQKDAIADPELRAGSTLFNTTSGVYDGTSWRELAYI
jgi:hypothetical protein